jgi:hypothetical protein
MEIPSSKKSFEITEIKPPVEFCTFVDSDGTGIKIVAESYSNLPDKIIKLSAGPFAKWLRLYHSEVKVDLPHDIPKLALHDREFWLPLVYLANDVTLQMFLGIVANYIYDRMKGALKGENKTVHLEAYYRDQQDGLTKKFKYDGPARESTKLFKKFDLNKFME